MNIREFQDMMRQLYFQKDSARGATGTYNWLVDEVAELGESLRAADKEALEKEFADVIAWLASLANVTNVDLETAALKKYHYKCPKCRHSPCECAFKR
ncbi:nucleotide pyrophosphohydrolase [Candidatus Bathyarchaeota archaeon]|nr:nucleotide pyrophosphohydrolase [Candidatus Bathyarchaeota archaeon]